jgi:hypothetical protein
MDKSLVARAQEMAANSPEKITAEESLAQAILERFDDDPKLIARYFADAVKGWTKELRVRTYTLPEQATLFSIPETIAIITDEGDLLIPADLATAGQVRQWVREGRRHHKSQEKKFARFDAQLKSLELNPKENYKDQLRALESKGTDDTATSSDES